MVNVQNYGRSDVLGYQRSTSCACLTRYPGILCSDNLHDLQHYNEVKIDDRERQWLWSNIWALESDAFFSPEGVKMFPCMVCGTGLRSLKGVNASHVLPGKASNAPGNWWNIVLTCNSCNSREKCENLLVYMGSGIIVCHSGVIYRIIRIIQLARWQRAPARSSASHSCVSSVMYLLEPPRPITNNSARLAQKTSAR